MNAILGSSLRGTRSAARALAAVPIAVLLLVTGLPAFAEQQAAVVKLWDHHIHDKKFRQQVFKEFNKTNPEIRVEYTSQVGAAYETTLDAAFRSGTPPDIFVPVGAASLSKLLETGWIIPLDDLVSSKEELRKWMARFPQNQQPFAENYNMFNGKVYTWPIGTEGGRMMLFWNVKLFREAGLRGPDGGEAVPETWEDMRQFAKKVTELGQGKSYGIVHGIKDPMVWDQDLFWSIAPSAGWPYVIDFRKGGPDYASPILKAAVQMWLDMKKDGSVFPGDLSMDDEQAKFRFSQDLAGMIFGGYWVPGGLLAISDSLEFDVVLPPVPDRGERKGYLNIGILAGSGEYVVSSKTKNRDAVWKVIQFMTSREYQEGWVKAGGGYSVFPEYNKPEYFPHPTIAKIALMGQTGRRTTPGSLISTDAWKIWNYFRPEKPSIWDTVQGIWIGQLGLDSLRDLDRRQNEAWDAAIAELRKLGYPVTRATYTFPDWDPAENYPRSAAPSR